MPKVEKPKFHMPKVEMPRFHIPICQNSNCPDTVQPQKGPINLITMNITSLLTFPCSCASVVSPWNG